MDPNNPTPYDYAVVNLTGLITEGVGQYNRTAQECANPSGYAGAKALPLVGIGFLRAGFLAR